MKIQNINLSIGKSSANKNENINENPNNFSSNPFGVSFKGNVIQADVFEKSSDTNVVKEVNEKSKVFASAIVGGINNFNEAFQSRMNSIVSFGKKIKSDVFNKFEKIAEATSSFNFNDFTTTLRNRFFPDNQYSVENLATLPVSNLESMLSSEINM